MNICCENVWQTQKLYKKWQNKYVKLKSYAPEEKVWLNNKYIKIKQNRKLKAKFFNLFQVLFLVKKSSIQIRITKKKKNTQYFYILLLEQETIRKEQVDKNTIRLKFKANNSKEFVVKGIYNKAMYAREFEGHYL